MHPPTKAGGERVCDGCFNRLTSEAEARMLAVAKASKILAASAAEEAATAPPIPPAVADDSSIKDARSPSMSSANSLSDGSVLGSVTGAGSVDSGNGSSHNGGGAVSPQPETPSSTSLSPAGPSQSDLRKSASGEALSRVTAAAANAASARNTVGEVAEAFVERDRRLKQTKERADDLVEVCPIQCVFLCFYLTCCFSKGARDFSRMTRQLKESVKRKSTL